MIRRRELIRLLGSAATTPAMLWPLAARAQQPDRLRRVAVLMPLGADDSESQARIAAFLQDLQQLGWTDGHNVRIDARWSAGNAADMRKHVAEMPALAPDVIVASTSYFPAQN